MTEKYCFICGDSRPNSLEKHHLVPKRYGGSDNKENLITICASCHSAIEKLYDDSFYKRLGVGKDVDRKNSVELYDIESLNDLNDPSDVYYIEGDNRFYSLQGSNFVHISGSGAEISLIQIMRKITDIKGAKLMGDRDEAMSEFIKSNSSES